MPSTTLSTLSLSSAVTSGKPDEISIEFSPNVIVLFSILASVIPYPAIVVAESALFPSCPAIVVAKLGSSPRAVASSFKVLSVSGAELTKSDTLLSTYPSVANPSIEGIVGLFLIKASEFSSVTFQSDCTFFSASDGACVS